MTTLQTALNGAATITTATAPTMGNINSYSAASGALAITLPALSSLNAGASCIVEKSVADVSSNTITHTAHSGDTFDDLTATLVLQYSGEKRTLQVVSILGTKYWKITQVSPGSGGITVNGASKLVSIGDLGYMWASNANSTSTAGTSEMIFTVGVAATNITAMWAHWYGDPTTHYDTDPSGPISFSASMRVVSTTNPGTVTNTLFRFTFAGRINVTLDPGGRVTADVLGMSLAPGDVVAVRTYLSSGTAYPPLFVFGTAGSGGWGGFTASTDLTAPGSAAIASSNGYYYGPSILLGRTGAGHAKSVLLLGDSIGLGGDDGAGFTRPAIGSGQGGGFAIRALSGIGGLLNMAQGGDAGTLFQTTTGSVRRLAVASLCTSAIIEYGAIDLFGSVTAAVVEAANLNIATEVRRLGITKVFLTTVLPHTTSTDGWATTANQTPAAGDSQRVVYNTWARAGCPIDPTTLAPVAAGTPGALLAGSFGHPITGIFDTAATVESALNSGVFKQCNRVVTGSITSGTNVITAASGGFSSANQEAGGDLGTGVIMPGAGAGGALFYAVPIIIPSGTQLYMNANASTTVTNGPVNVGVMTVDGSHPTPHAHYLMSQAINTALL